MKSRQTNYGSIAVAVEECTVAAGGVVCGDVVVDVKEPLKAFTSVLVSLTGTVTTYVDRGTGKHRHRYQGKEVVCNVVCHMVPDCVKASFVEETSCYSLSVGEYRMPFRINVPQDCPQSDNLRVFQAKANVEYLLQAVVTLPESGAWNAVKQVISPQSVEKRITIVASPNPHLEMQKAQPFSALCHKSFTFSR